MPIIYRGKRQLKVRVLGLALGVAAAAALCWLAWTVGRPAPEPPSPGQSLPEEKSPAPLPEQDPSSPAETYDFTRPAPERAPVDNSYFQNAAFVGDSRTDGFLIYSGIGTGKNLTSNGLSIFKLEEKKALTIDGEKYTLLEALALEQYSQVYLSLGVNELGYYNDAGFYQSYCAAIDHIRRLQPQAVIYIQGLIPLNEGQIVAANGNKYNLTNDHLRVYNDLMRQAAEEKQAVFLDLYTEFVDENGELPAEGSHDGVHLSAEYCRRWLEYLKTHTVEFDTLYPDGPPPVEEPEAETVQPEGSGEE
ncbi:GDSL-type esterase/lipase family protein [Oscillospiraceae bacterium 50-16]